MAKIKSKKWQTMVYKAMHRKPKIVQHEPFLESGLGQVLRKDKQFLLH